MTTRKDAAVLTCGVGELLLSDLLQLEDLLQSLRDLGPTDAYLLALPHLEKKQINVYELIYEFKANVQSISHVKLGE